MCQAVYAEGLQNHGYACTSQIIILSIQMGTSSVAREAFNIYNIPNIQVFNNGTGALNLIIHITFSMWFSLGTPPPWHVTIYIDVDYTTNPTMCFKSASKVLDPKVVQNKIWSYSKMLQNSF